MRTFHIHRAPVELCAHPSSEERRPPRELVEPRGESRLVRPLREAARTRDAREILVRASLAGYGARRGESLGIARALADLAATGAMASATLRSSALSGNDLAALAAQRLRNVRADEPELVGHAWRARERARLVARYLEQDAPGRATLARAHPELAEWIAVSGEDDTPARPVNIAPPSGIERTIDVRVRDLVVRARHVLTGAPLGDAPLVLLVHGHCSRIEEHERLVAALAEKRDAGGRPKYTVLGVDLPGWGYSTHLDHEQVAPLDAPGTPLLDFHEEFLERFVEEVTAEVDMPKRVACIAGGSLGGNLVLRLAERGAAWIERFAAWSPASVWGALTGDLIKGLGLQHTREHMASDETEHSRRAYFTEVFATRICLTGRTQPEMWYHSRYPCRARHIQAAISDRREIYDADYRRWHWRVAYEQLVFSHVTRVKGLAPWQRIRGPVLLLAGSDDNFRWTHIYDRTRDLAANLAGNGVPGTCLLLKDTGHSIHDERPRLLATALDRFLARA